MAAQASLCLAWSETPEDTFVVSWLTCIRIFMLLCLYIQEHWQGPEICVISHICQSVKWQIEDFRNPVEFAKNCTQNKNHILVPYENVCLKVNVSSAKTNMILDSAIIVKVKLIFLSFRSTPGYFLERYGKYIFWWFMHRRQVIATCTWNLIYTRLETPIDFIANRYLEHCQIKI